MANYQYYFDREAIIAVREMEHALRMLHMSSSLKDETPPEFDHAVIDLIERMALNGRTSLPLVP